MKRWIPVGLGLLLAAGAGFWLLRHRGAAEEAAPRAQVAPGPGSAPALKLDEAQLKALDLKVERAERRSVGDTAELHGVVLDPLPFLDLEAKRRAAAEALRSARAAEAAARSELARVQALHEDDRGASDKALQEAQGAFADASAKLIAAEGEARQSQAAWAQTGLEGVEGLAEFRAVLVRLELPLGAAAPAPLRRSLDAHLAGQDKPLKLHLLGLAPAGSALTGGLGLLGRIEAPGLRPGLPLDARLPQGAAERVLVPRAALLWAGDAAQVFVQLEDGRFQAREVKVAFASGEDVALEEGLEGGERVVVQGAQALQGELDRAAEPAQPGKDD